MISDDVWKCRPCGCPIYHHNGGRCRGATGSGLCKCMLIFDDKKQRSDEALNGKLSS